jgi:hypothetical protein
MKIYDLFSSKTWGGDLSTREEMGARVASHSPEPPSTLEMARRADKGASMNNPLPS